MTDDASVDYEAQWYPRGKCDRLDFYVGVAHNAPPPAAEFTIGWNPSTGPGSSQPPQVTAVVSFGDPAQHYVRNITGANEIGLGPERGGPMQLATLATPRVHCTW